MSESSNLAGVILGSGSILAVLSGIFWLIRFYCYKKHNIILPEVNLNEADIMSVANEPIILEVKPITEQPLPQECETVKKISETLVKWADKRKSDEAEI